MKAGMEVFVDLYAYFGVPPRASTETIREAYLQRARAEHPDKGGSVDGFSALARAYAVLSSDSHRKTYDAQLKVSNKFPELCGLCDGIGRRRKGIAGYAPCPKCDATGRYKVAVKPFAKKTASESPVEKFDRELEAARKRRSAAKLKAARDILKKGAL